MVKEKLSCKHIMAICLFFFFLQKLPRRRSFNTFDREFALSDCLDYVKAGVEAIIEDQVTLRFETEELKVRTKIWIIFFLP